jgi:ribonuclease PH
MDFIEIQGTGEEKAFSKEQFNGLMDLAEQGIFDLFKLQNQIINHK